MSRLLTGGLTLSRTRRCTLPQVGPQPSPTRWRVFHCLCRGDRSYANDAASNTTKDHIVAVKFEKVKAQLRHAAAQRNVSVETLNEAIHAGRHFVFQNHDCRSANKKVYKIQQSLRQLIIKWQFLTCVNKAEKHEGDRKNGVGSAWQFIEPLPEQYFLHFDTELKATEAADTTGIRPRILREELESRGKPGRSSRRMLKMAVANFCKSAKCQTPLELHYRPSKKAESILAMFAAPRKLANFVDSSCVWDTPRPNFHLCHLRINIPNMPTMYFQGQSVNSDHAEELAAWQALKSCRFWNIDGPVYGPNQYSINSPWHVAEGKTSLEIRRSIEKLDWIGRDERKYIFNVLKNEKSFIETMKDGSQWFRFQLILAVKTRNLHSFFDILKEFRRRNQIPPAEFLGFMLHSMVDPLNREIMRDQPGGLAGSILDLYAEYEALFKENTFSLSIRGLVEDGAVNEALYMFDELKIHGYKPHSRTVVPLILAKVF